MSAITSLFRLRSTLINGPLIKCFSSNSNNIERYDVVISGGGMVGAAMAAALGKESLLQDKKVLLLEASGPTRYSLPESYNSRVCALSPATVNLLSSFGAWESISKMRFREVKKMQVWDACADSLITFGKGYSATEESLAYIVENDVILEAIVRSLDTMKSVVRVAYNAKVKSYTLPSPSDSNALPRLDLADGRSIETKLLIGADGFKSLLRTSAGLSAVQWDYDQVAVVATLKLTPDSDNYTAWQRFLPTGPIAMLPLSDTASCMIWSTSRQHARELLQMSEEVMVDEINSAFWSDRQKNATAEILSKALDSFAVSVGLEGRSSLRLPPVVNGVELASRASFPLGLCHASQYVKRRIALIGDSVHRIHPMAGQGVNLGFGDVSELCEVIVRALSDGADPGSLTYLLDYETSRQRRVVPIMAAIDGLNRLYSTDFTPLVALRALGLQATNALTPIKNLLVRAATS